jgi:geranylgeranyl diphosphate synthase type I
MISGQLDDLAFEGRVNISTEAYLRMAEGKTAALLGCAASIGAVLAGAAPSLVDALDRYGHSLGLAFQAVDDILGLWGTPEVTGKPVGSDLRARKASLPIVTALEAGGPAAAELSAILANRILDDAAVARASELVAHNGGRQRAEQEAERRLDEAIAALDAAPMGALAREELAEVATFVVRREH